MDLSNVFSRMPSLGWPSMRVGIPNLMQMVYRNEVTQALVKIETPFDFYIEMMNLLSRLPGMTLLKVNRQEGLVITWDEINEVWGEGLKNIKFLPNWSINKLIRNK